MSLSVSSYPVPSPGQNVFGGGSPVEIIFKREDLAVTDTEQGADNTLIVNLGSDITSALNVGEYVYLSSGVYETSGEVLETNSAYIRLDVQWLGSATTGGYINYKQNWYAELLIINPDNELDELLPFTLRDDGDSAGNITIDLSIINDLNKIEFPDFSAANEMQDSRVKFDIKYREIWRESLSTAYTRISNPIIIYPAKESGTIEAFNNGFTQPEYYVGYPNGATFIHSDDDPLAATNVVFYYDEKDINGDVIKANQIIGSLTSADVYGRLFAPLYNLSLLPDTEYITLTTETAAIPEFSATDFTNDFNIT